MLSRSTGRRLRLPLGAALLALVALCATAALALAAHPVAGGHYTGHETGNSGINAKISFKVNHKGTKVRDLKTKPDGVFNFPSCTPDPTATQTSKPAEISNKGKFKGVVHYTYSGGGEGKAVITGKFKSHGREKGVLTGTFDNPDCNGAAAYTTNAN
jgi:hypothetical protein